MVLGYCVSTTSLLLISTTASKEKKKEKKNFDGMKGLEIRRERSYDNGN